MDSSTLTPEQIKKYRDWLSNAVPYTEAELSNIPFDSTDYDMAKSRAYMAQKALRKAGLLEEETT